MYVKPIKTQPLSSNQHYRLPPGAKQANTVVNGGIEAVGPVGSPERLMAVLESLDIGPLLAMLGGGLPRWIAERRPTICDLVVVARWLSLDPLDLFPEPFNVVEG